MSGRAVPALVVASVVVYAWQVIVWLRADEDEWWYTIAAPLLAAGTVAAVALVSVTLVRRIGGARTSASSSSAPGAVIAVLIGLVVATPVEMSWSDGCNQHEARVPAGLSTVVVLGKPETMAYAGTKTLMQCVDGSAIEFAPPGLDE